jgi:uncharacterized membrane protein
MPASAQSGLSENAAGAISYITFLPAIVFLVMPPYNASPYVRFHCWQSIFLCVAAFLVNVFLDLLTLLTFFMAPFAWLVRIVTVLWMVLWLVCVMQALNGRRYKLPIIGDIAERLSTAG